MGEVFCICDFFLFTMLRNVQIALATACLLNTAIAKTCCFVKWGDESTCGGYSGSGGQGLCNTDWSHSCVLDTDCPDGPTPTPTPTPTPSPSPSSGYPLDKLLLAGRWYNGDGGMQTSWGQSVVARFKGSSSVKIRVSGGGRYYSYRVDGQPWTKVMVGANAVVTLANNLNVQQEHTVHFGKSDEASYGTWTFHDLMLDRGYEALKPEATKLKFEAIGDSITAGFKVDCHPGGGSPTTANEDQYETYVSHLADVWGTDDWNVIARSGIGAGPVSGAGGTILEEYKCRDYSSLRCSDWGEQQWDFGLESRQPDVVTINIGTNDYAFGNPSLTTFKTNLKEFISFVRSKHQQATIFCICPLQYSLNGPLASANASALHSEASGRDVKWETMMKGVREAAEELHDSKVIYVATGDPNAPWMDGATEFSDWTHPTVDGHAHFAKELEKVLTPIVRRNHPEAFAASTPMVV